MKHTTPILLIIIGMVVIVGAPTTAYMVNKSKTKNVKPEWLTKGSIIHIESEVWSNGMTVKIHDIKGDWVLMEEVNDYGEPETEFVSTYNEYGEETSTELKEKIKSKFWKRLSQCDSVRKFTPFKKRK